MTTLYRTSELKRRRSTKAEIAEIDTAIYEIAAEEQPITIRGLFYRMVSRGLVPKTDKAKNGVPSGYGIVQRRALAMRRNGSLPYAWITDGTRLTWQPTTWDGPERALAMTAANYRRALWTEQNVHVEMWAEKDAIKGVVYPVTADFDVPLMISRGFASESFLKVTAEAITDDGKPAVIYNLGDHDRDGVRAWHAIQKRLRAFVPNHIDLTFERIAVTPEQIEELDLPTRPDKTQSGFGDCVEVDAIPTPKLREIVGDSIMRHMDPEALRLTRIAEQSERQIMRRIANRWDDAERDYYEGYVR